MVWVVFLLLLAPVTGNENVTWDGDGSHNITRPTAVEGVETIVKKSVTGSEDSFDDIDEEEAQLPVDQAVDKGKCQHPKVYDCKKDICSDPDSITSWMCGDVCQNITQHCDGKCHNVTRPLGRYGGVQAWFLCQETSLCVWSNKRMCDPRITAPHYPDCPSLNSTMVPDICTDSKYGEGCYVACTGHMSGQCSYGSYNPDQ